MLYVSRIRIDIDLNIYSRPAATLPRHVHLVHHVAQSLDSAVLDLYVLPLLPSARNGAY